MFEVNLFTPSQFGAFIPWLIINRGPLSVLVHPNTIEIVDGKEFKDEERDHTQRATWLGERVPLDLSLFKRMKEIKAAAAKKADEEVKKGEGKLEGGKEEEKNGQVKALVQ
jgi:hypothetical protein